MKNIEVSKDHINTTYCRIELWRENAFPLRFVAVAELVLLFIAAPYLTAGRYIGSFSSLAPSTHILDQHGWFYYFP
jgi:hypothetical protein